MRDVMLHAQEWTKYWSNAEPAASRLLSLGSVGKCNFSGGRSKVSHAELGGHSGTHSF